MKRHLLLGLLAALAFITAQALRDKTPMPWHAAHWTVTRTSYCCERGHGSNRAECANDQDSQTREALISVEREAEIRERLNRGESVDCPAG
jgi:hypothetical protein